MSCLTLAMKSDLCHRARVHVMGPLDIYFAKLGVCPCGLWCLMRLFEHHFFPLDYLDLFILFNGCGDFVYHYVSNVLSFKYLSCCVCFVVSLYLIMSYNSRSWNVLVWNVRGINSQNKWDCIIDKISESAASIVCLQETKRESF